MDGTIEAGRGLFISRAGESKRRSGPRRCARLAGVRPPHPACHGGFRACPVSGKGTDKTSLLLNQTPVNYISRAAYAEAEPLLRRAVKIFERFERDTGHRHLNYAAAVGDLEALLAQLGSAAGGAATVKGGATEPSGKQPAKRGLLARPFGGG